MGVQDEIYEWVRGFEPWKQDLFLRAAAGPNLSATDVEAAVALLLGEQDKSSGPRLVGRRDIPGGQDSGTRFSLSTISEADNVNALRSDQTLRFAPTGITIVYGKNGAGKTGYARICKHAGRTLHHEEVRPNVASGSSSPPTATVTITTGGQVDSFALKLDDPPPAGLAELCVFDAHAGERYVKSENAVDYVPVALNSVGRLADGLLAMGVELDRRIEAATPPTLDLRPFGEGTVVRGRLASLGPQTRDSEIEALATLSEEEETQRDTLQRQRGEILARNAGQLRETAEREARMARSLRDELERIGGPVCAEAVTEARAEFATLAQADEAAKLAAQRFENEPLSGVGSSPWRVLWNAAKDFAREAHGHVIPPDHDPAHCPLCMQELSPDARQRLLDFEAFVTENVNAQLEQAKRNVDARRDTLPDFASVAARHREVLDLLGGNPSQPGCAVTAWLGLAALQAEHLRTGDLVEQVGVVEPPIAALETWITGREQLALQHAALEDRDEQARIDKELAELNARLLLKERLDEFLRHLAALRQVARFKEALAKLSTTGISTKITAFSRAFIKADLEMALNQQLHALRFDGLEVETTTRTVAGTPMLGLCFKTVSGAALEHVLSTGEQRRVALAMFLAEMEVADDGNPVVLDDPVCSIDQEGRRHIARTLVKLAKRRQVVIFTHEISFVNMLRTLAEREMPAVPTAVQHVVRTGREAGVVRARLPWEGLRAKDRVEPLEAKLHTATEACETDDPEVYGPPVRDFCNYLRQSFEKAVEDGPLAGVVTRGDDAVHTRQLKDVHISSTVLSLVERGVTENSPWVHDRSSHDNSILPTVEEMMEGLACFKDLLDTLKEEQRQREKDRASRKSKEKAQLKAIDSGQTLPRQSCDEAPPEVEPSIRSTIAPRNA